VVAEPRVFGIRHHGPGSARQLVEALDALQPSVVLIEGPSDASDLLPMLADPAMVPPVALLTYAVDDPARALFWPFAVYSPEYQAACWAVRHGARTRFIDLPASWRLAPPAEAVVPEGEPDAPVEAIERVAVDAAAVRLERDPIGALAQAAGYEDGESWWRDVIEENPAPGPVFGAVADAMAALREAAPAPSRHEAAREAHMRLEIAKAVKDTDGDIAVVCGAWHVPALTMKVPAAVDRALLRDAPKVKTLSTWAPWTSPRLASGGGYGAGVTAPGWCAHIWETPPALIPTRWLVRVAAALRGQGHDASTASVIEAERLAVSLAAIRDRPAPGFEELREAVIACLCLGSSFVWDTIGQGLLIGAEVGSIPDNVPLAPLLEDLQREQKRLRLKPEALDRELAIDLRAEGGLDRSTLLHRLAILGVPWGTLADSGRSRGTFRERWVLRWEPEYGVRLVENLVHGPTIAQAAAGRMRADLFQATALGPLAVLVLAALTARLPDAVESGIARIEHRAGLTGDCLELLTAVPPIANTLRYGEARQTDRDQLESLLARIVARAALALPYAARDLDQDAAVAMRDAILGADGAIALAELAGGARDAWRSALRALLDDAGTSPLLAGAAGRMLYEREEISPEEATIILGRMLSPGRPVTDAAGFFEGFFDGAGERLIHDKPLRDSVDRWLLSLDPDHFTAHLPLFRRAFSNLDRMRRRRLLDALFNRETGALPGRTLAPDAGSLWPLHFARLAAILAARPAPGFADD
jgi:hypothetical protein